MQTFRSDIPGFVMLLGVITWIALGSGCDFSSSSSEEETQLPDSTEISSLSDPTSVDSITQTQKSRGLDMSTARITNFSLKDYLPNLYRLVEGDAEMSKDLEQYAQQIIVRESLQTEEDLVAIFEQREKEIIPHMFPFFENMDNDQFYNQFQTFEGELNQIGLTLQTAEAMFIGIGPAPVLEADIDRLASDAYRLYLAFLNADAEASQGEYPFLDMKPYQDMILIGEQMNALPANRYTEKIQARYTEAILAFTDVHVVRSATAREEDGGSVMVGGVTTEHYPFMTEKGTLSEFAQSQPSSALSKVTDKIANNMSEISDKPENVYVVVTEWADDREMAQSRVVAHLTAGEDIPHYLRIRRGDGSDRYAIAYRFYEDSGKADAALEAILPEFPDARLIFCSVRKQELYQLGPSAD